MSFINFVDCQTKKKDVKRAKKSNKHTSTIKEPKSLTKNYSRKPGKVPKWTSPFKTSDLFPTDGRWVTSKTDDYIIARLVDKEGQPEHVDVAGVDIGKVHVGICGFDTSDLSVGKWPRVTVIALVRGGKFAAHFACDRLDTILVSDLRFGWFRACRSIYIEQQLPVNPQAKQIAQGIRSSQRTVRLINGKTPDVNSVSGQAKYKVAQFIAPEVLDDKLRSLDLTGIKGKPLRKLLSERDVYKMLVHTEQKNALDMISTICSDTDQIHDMTDSVLLGLAGELFNSDRKITSKNTPYGQGKITIKKKSTTKRKRMNHAL